PKGQPIAGKINPLYLSIQPKSANIVNNGTKMTCFGNIIAAISVTKMILRPGNSFFANTYPAVAPTKQTPAFSAVEMKKLLKVQRYTGLLNSTFQFSIVVDTGNHSGGMAVATTCALNAPVKIQ